MTALLASVRSAAEAQIALAAGVDIIDLKEPRQGVLGALPAPVIRAAVARVAGRRPVSATAGDLPMVPAVVGQTAARIGALGVDFVKVGIFPGGDLEGCLDALGHEAARGLKLVAVLFADLEPDPGQIESLAARGFAGVMLDTAEKRGGGLRRHLDDAALRRFVLRGKASGLFTGLAGSLRLVDVGALLELGPDYLGFRGALTAGGRGAALDPAAIAALRRAIPATGGSYQPSRASRASAAAGAQQAARSRTSAVPASSVAKSR